MCDAPCAQRDAPCAVRKKRAGVKGGGTLFAHGALHNAAARKHQGAALDAVGNAHQGRRRGAPGSAAAMGAALL